MAVTIYDVAKDAGVSPRTVSNVINDYPFVAAQTRERVQRSVAALGYRPNVLARNLRRGRTGMLAFAVPELGVPYFSELCQAVIDQISEQQYTVIVEQTDGDPKRELELLESRRQGHVFDGLIFSPLGIGANELTAAEGRVPVVLLGERVTEAPFDHVSIDNVAAARSAVAHLAGLGRRRIAAIGDQPYETGETAQLRTQGYRDALHEAGLEVDERLIRQTPQFHRDSGLAAMLELLAEPEHPDAVFCYNDLLAAGAMRAILQHGLRVPQDIAVVGFDDIEEGRYSTPTLSTVAPNKSEIADLAIRQLMRRIAGDKSAPVDLVASYTLEVRESTVGVMRRRRSSPSRRASAR